MKELDLESKKFIMITDKGVAAKGYERTELVPTVLYAFLNLWNDCDFEVDITEAAKRIINLLFDMKIEDQEDSLYDLLGELFDDDDEEGNG